jgi:hypothetical protein
MSTICTASSAANGPTDADPLKNVKLCKFSLQSSFAVFPPQKLQPMPNALKWLCKMYELQAIRPKDNRAARGLLSSSDFSRIMSTEEKCHVGTKTKETRKRSLKSRLTF